MESMAIGGRAETLWPETGELRVFYGEEQEQWELIVFELKQASEIQFSSQSQEIDWNVVVCGTK